MKSYWIESVENERKEFPSLNSDIEADVCIVGGGLTGLTTAYYLSKANMKVAILEKERICEQTSGLTTAKITSQHDLFYDYLIQSQGKEKAKQYLVANEKAIRDIEKIIKDENINCDFEKQSAYVYTTKVDEVEQIKKEVEAVNSLGLNAKFVTDLRLPFKIQGAIEFENQAQFNPCKYAQGLVNAINSRVRIFEKTKVIDVKKFKDNDTIENKETIEYDIEIQKYKDISEENNKEIKYKVITENGHAITAKYVVLATHYPTINAPGYYFLKMYQEMSYLIGVETKEPLPKGMYINIGNPTLSIRIAQDNGKALLLIGGNGHKTGERKDISGSYKYLEDIAKKYYKDTVIKYRWCTEDCISLDKIPYIGEFSNLMQHVYVGTGYKKWGMTSSNVAANIIVDKILGKENPYEDVFSSTRLEPIKNHKELGNMMKEVATSWTIEKVKIPKEKLISLKKGTGGIVEFDDKKVGAYCDEDGKIYIIKPVCTHLGCELTWNNLEKTWDCPCHGSRFSYKGKSIYSPSIEDLKVIEIENE